MRSSVIALGIITVTFFGLLILLTRQTGKSNFELNAQQMHQQVQKVDYVLQPAELAQMEGYKIIDLRAPGLSIPRHLQDTLMIPMTQLLATKYQAFFEQGSPKVILADDPSHAHAAWMLLTQLGYENLFVMTPWKN